MGIAGVFWSTGVNNVEFLLVRREAEAVGLIHIVGNDGGLAGVRVKAVDIGWQFERRFVTFVIGHDPVTWIREPDGPVRMDHKVVGSVELLALKAIDEDGD